MPESTPLPRDRLALHVVQLGAIAVMLASVPYKAFDLDRFFVPKELVLAASATVAALLVLSRCRRLTLSLVDLVLAVFLIVSTCSSLAASNWWVAGRALAISWSGLLLFWVAAALRRNGLARGLVVAAVAAVVVGVITALVQAYAGTTTDLFSVNRAPGGSFGNRNFMAHVAAMTAPLVILATLGARRRGVALVGTLSTFILSAGLVLSRTRSAWLALGVALGVMFLLAAALGVRLSRGRGARRAVSLALAACAGIACAVLLPNRLQWKSASPYLDSIRGVVNYHDGSGRGRLTQYASTLALVRKHPLLGVGPGNWAVAYPAVASRGDPSLALEEGMTDNPWPSSDWIAFASERGIIATACLGAALIGLMVRAMGELRRTRGGADDDRSVYALALIGTIVATLVVGAFDAVLLVAGPTMLLWTLAGSLAPPVERGVSLERGVRRLAPVVIAVVGVVAIGRSAFQLAAMRVASSSTRLAATEEAARLDPGSYRLQMRAAEAFAARKDCAKTAEFARAAHALYPSAAAPKRYLGCRT